MTLADAALVAIAFVAVTTHVYAVPLDKPATDTGLALAAPVKDNAPLVQLALYPVIAAPPFDVGETNASSTRESPAVAIRLVGAAGAVAALDKLPDPPPPQATRLKIKPRLTRLLMSGIRMNCMLGPLRKDSNRTPSLPNDLGEIWEKW
jgi:hypothetical protein